MKTDFCQENKKNKLTKLILSLNTLEQKALKQEFSLMRHEAFACLYLLLLQPDHFKSLEVFGFDKIVFFKLLFPEDSYNDKKMRYIMSALVSRIEDFLVHQKINSNEGIYRMYLSQIYFERNLPEYSNYNIKQGSEKVQLATYEAYQLEAQNFEANYLGTRAKEVNLQEISSELDQFFIIEKLRWMNLVLSYQNMYHTDYIFSFKDEILNQALHYETKNPQISIYKSLFTLQQDVQNEALFLILKDEVKSSYQLFPQKDMYSILLLLINICIKHINKNKMEFCYYAIELYELGFENKLLHDRGYLGPFTFKNAIVVALKLKDYEWAERQIERLSEQLEPKHQLSYKSYCLSKLYFEQKRYKEALKWLHKVEYEDVLLSLDAKSNLLKIYYELNELEPLISHLNSFKTFVKRKSISPFHQKNFLNLIKVTEALIKVKLYDRPLAKVHELLQNLEPLTSKNWLLEQVERLS